MSQDGFHIERTHTLFGPMDVTEENVGYPLRVDLLGELVELPILADDSVPQDVLTAQGDRTLIRKILATSDNGRSVQKEIPQPEPIDSSTISPDLSQRLKDIDILQGSPSRVDRPGGDTEEEIDEPESELDSSNE